MARLLEHVVTHAVHGKLYQSLDELADALGVDRKTVLRAIADAEAEQLIRYDAPDPEPGKRRPAGTITLRPDLRPDVSFVEIG